MKPMKLGVLASGSGTDFQSIIDAMALERAREHGIVAVCIPHRGLSREEHEKEIVDELKKHDVDLVILAGYIRMLSPYLVKEFEGRLLNIHPALLPKYGGAVFYGMKVHEAVIAAGDKVSGCTVHVVTDGIDTGPIVLQREVDVLPDDTAETLAARVLKEEHKLLPEAIKHYIESENIA